MSQPPNGNSNASSRLALLSNSLSTTSAPPLDIKSSHQGELLGHLTLNDTRLPVYETNDADRLPREDLLLDHRDPVVIKEISWFIRKWHLGQDVFLLSAPGPYPRRLALTFLSLLHTPYEYVSLHRDIGEGELKQSREIRPGGKLEYVDSPVVRAAKEGKVLILDGIERCERGILPILNNLLENREMNLDDGTHIVSASRYSLMLQSGESTENFIPCHPSFRVIALGCPVPPYPGMPIDPPFRSRFQARYLDPVIAGKILAQQELDKVPIEGLLADVKKIVSRLADVVLTLQVQKEMRHKMASGISTANSDLPLFPSTALFKLAKFFSIFPPPSDSSHVSPAQFLTLLHVVHPALAFASRPAKRALEDALKSAGFDSWADGIAECDPAEEVTSQGEGIFGWSLESIEKRTEETAQVTFVREGVENVTVTVAAGPLPYSSYPLSSTDSLHLTPRFIHLLTSLFQLHSLSLFDISFVPSTASLQSASSSTSLVLSSFSSLLGYSLEVVHLYKELGGRELLMRRVVGGTGGVTSWVESPLVKGMKEGQLVWLEAVDTIGPTFASLARLVMDREGELWEGKRLVPRRTSTDTPSSSSKILDYIHPSFRLITTASKSTPAPEWLDESISSNLISLPTLAMPLSEERALLSSTGCPSHHVEQLEFFATKYRQLTSSPGSKSRRLGTASLIRIATRLARFPKENMREMLERTLLVDFLPNTEKEQVSDLMDEVGLKASSLEIFPPVEVGEKSLRFRSQTLEGEQTVYEVDIFDPKDDPENSSHVPHMDSFLDNQSQTQLMRDIAVDLQFFSNHLLLQGAQGVGKNKIIDRLLQLTNRGREYIQLSRDSTTQSLMQQIALDGGILRYLETPLIRAIRLGRVIVIDEVDKAAPPVVAALASLAARGEMTLPDGRRVRPTRDHPSFQPNDVVVHPSFRLILLGNRPGFPFLGNPFLRVIGDNFSCYAVSNPDLDSELTLLQQLAPDLDPVLLKSLVQAFQDLRTEFNKGTLTYPFSLRELIALVRHLKAFDEPLEAALRNCFDFDVHSPDTLDTLYEVLRRYRLGVERVGIDAVRGEGDLVNGKREEKKGEIIEFEPKGDTGLSEPKFGQEDDKEHSGGNKWAGGTGGRDTAGLGGRGGYMRLWKGGDVKQIPDSLKAQVPDEIKDRAREMARKELAQKLAEIDLTSSQSSIYSRYHDSVSAHVQSLVNFLENLEAKEEERVWLKRQSDGELDESRITEGITGEAAVYKRRGQEKPELGRPQLKPKRIRFVFDLSASMYRNQMDGRLARSLETAVMILEAFDRLSATGKSKYRIDILGHSGEEAQIPLVAVDSLPTNAGDRFRIIQKMALIPQYCFAGDMTIEAIEKGIDAVAETDADDHFLIAITDANFERYGIKSEDVKRALNRNSKVKASLIAIGEGGECEWLPKLLPGKAHRVKETGDIARTIRSILGQLLGTGF